MLFSDERVFMNTIIRIQVVSGKGTIFTRSQMQKAFECFDQVVKNFSRFSKDSELSKLNASGGQVFNCSPELFSLVSSALEVAKKVDGAYDPTVIDLLEAYGYDSKQDFSRLKDLGLMQEISKLAKNRPSFREIELNTKNSTVKLQKQQRIDLGSIGKGYAIDLAFKELAKHDFNGFLINAGGDLRSFGTNAQNLPWKVALFKSQLPNHIIDNENFLGTVELQNKGICGSGGWARKIGIFHHLLNPVNGLPINEFTQSFVIADTASQADVWASALFVTGPELLSSLEEQGMSGLIIDYNGQVFKNENFQYDNLI